MIFSTAIIIVIILTIVIGALFLLYRKKIRRSHEKIGLLSQVQISPPKYVNLDTLETGRLAGTNAIDNRGDGTSDHYIRKGLMGNKIIEQQPNWATKRYYPPNTPHSEGIVITYPHKPHKKSIFPIIDIYKDRISELELEMENTKRQLAQTINHIRSRQSMSIAIEQLTKQITSIEAIKGAIKERKDEEQKSILIEKTEKSKKPKLEPPPTTYK